MQSCYNGILFIEKEVVKMNKVRIFTDGACSENPGPGGWASVFCTDTKCKQFSGGDENTTNNRMELFAIKYSLERILKCRTKHSYEIYSDSAYCINSIKQKWIFNWEKNNWKTLSGDNVKNRDMWIDVLNLLRAAKDKNISITFHKVKGHSGNTFNELADKLAKEEVQKVKRRILK